MFTDHTLITINITCIGFLVFMLVILAAATRMKGSAGWAALVIVTTTVPAELANLMQALASDSFPYYYYPASFLNAMCMPSLWFFTRRQLDKSFRFTTHSWLHVIPAIISFATYVTYYTSLSGDRLQAEKVIMESGGSNLPSNVNDLIIYAQMFIYFFFIFRYIRRRKKYLKNNYADSEYFTTQCVSSFIAVFTGLFLIVFITFAIDPQSLAWVIPILNAIAMAYLVYIVVFHSTTAYLNRLSNIPAEVPERETASVPAMSEEQMKEICDRVTDYLQGYKAYTNPDFSINMLSLAIDIHSRNISIAINNYLHKNFFDLVNEMRIEEAKRLLLGLNSEYTVESVYPDCGFRSRASFFRAFGKLDGVSPAKWLKQQELSALQ